MKLIFKKDGKITVIPQEESAATIERIGANTQIVIESMISGIPVVADGGEYTIFSKEFQDEIGAICESCQGTGEVQKMEPVYPGEPHMAAIGTEKCICQLSSDEYEE